MNPDSISVLPEEAGQRIDKLLAEHYPLFSRTYFQRLIVEGFVLLNGHPVKKRITPESGDEIEVCFQLTPESSLSPEAIPLDILYEDEHLIAINKPAGMVVHPAPGHPTGTFVNALLAHCQSLAPGSDPLRPGIVHRLDKETSGLLLAAKTPLAHQRLVHAFATRQIEKTYLAICVGRPPNLLLEAPIGRHPVHRKEMAVLPDTGKEAVTQIQVLAFNESISLALLRPRTGRTHQIRVHLKHLGTPVLGDPVYGRRKCNEEKKAPRQLLHAYRLQFTHPVTSSPLSLIAPLPQDLKEWIAHLGYVHK